MLWLLLGIGVFILFFYIYMVKPFQYWKRFEVAQYSVFEIYKELFLGFIPYRTLAEAIQKIYNDFSDKRYVGAYQFATPALFIRDPELIKQLTIKDFEFFSDHFSIFSENIDKIWFRNLVALRGEKWKNMRMILSPSFTSSKLKTIFPLIGDCAKQFVNHFNKMEGSVVTLEMKGLFSKFTNDVIATSAFGISCNSFENKNNEFFVMGKKMTNFNSILTNITVMTLIALPKVAKILRLELFNSKVVKFFENVITQNIQTREQHGIVRRDMIQLLLEAKKKTGGYEDVVEEENEIYAVIKDKENKNKKIQLTDEDIMAQAFLFFLAGFETVSVIMSFMAYELAVNPDVQEKLYQEIEETTRNFGKDPSYENLLKMKYLDMVISESLRKYPPSAITDRMCGKAYTLEPKNKTEQPIQVAVADVIWIPIYALHRDPKYFTDPDRFDPERFSDENKANIIPGTYIPFGIGPRHCIGNRFALMEIKVAVYYILSNFKFIVVDKTQIPLKFARSQVSMSPQKGIWLGLEKRVNN